MRRALLPFIPLLAAAAPASANAPVDFELAPPKAEVRSAESEHMSKPLRAPQRFQLVGFRWLGGPADAHIDMRVKRRGGRWTRWTHVPASADHAPDGGMGGRRASDPVWTGPADYVQYRTERRLPSLRLHFVRVGKPSARMRARSAQAAAPGAPDIVSRAEWGAASCPPRDAPSYGSVQAAFVHHTVSLNDYTPEEAPSVVLAICRYHRNSNGWDDVGYNFLVDKYGQIYEGRAGGIDQPVLGAQAQGFNAQTTGIAAIGNHHPPSGGVPLTNEGVDAIARLIAWKLPLHGQPTQGRVTLTSAGGSSNRFPAGARVSIDRIPGHRDGNHTACPGDALYAQLPDIRARASGVSPTTGALPRARLTAQRTAARVPLGELILLTGTVDPPKSSVQLVSQRKIRGRYRTVARTAVRARNGQIKKRFRPEHRALYRFRFYFLGDAENRRSRSKPVYVRTVKGSGGTAVGR